MHGEQRIENLMTDVPRARAKGKISIPVVTGLLRVADFAMVIGAAIAGYLQFVSSEEEPAHLADVYGMVSIMGALLICFILHLAECYNPRHLNAFRWQVGGIFYAWSTAGLVGLGIAFLTRNSVLFSRGFVVVWALLGVSLLLCSRLVLVGLYRSWTKSGRLRRSVIVVGGERTGERLIKRFLANNDASVDLVGVFDDRQSRLPSSVMNVSVLGTTDDLINMARLRLPDEIIIALPLSAHARIVDIVTRLKSLPVDVRLSFDGLDEVLSLNEVAHAGSVPLIKIADRPLGHWNGVAKRILDLGLASFFLVVLSPLMIAAAIGVRLSSPGPILFRQARFGFNNIIFDVLKFRTMRVEVEDQSGAIRTVKNDPRVTPFGRFLRSWSIDELPQLINVVRGEMSLVGPRAHAVTMRAGGQLYHDAVTEYFARHRVKPGLTGWAQVNGQRGEIDSVEKAQRRVDFDLYYIDHWSLGLDIQIVFQTISIVLRDRKNTY